MAKKLLVLKLIDSFARQQLTENMEMENWNSNLASLLVSHGQMETSQVALAGRTY
jgi:hypothetical protein